MLCLFKILNIALVHNNRSRKERKTKKASELIEGLKNRMIDTHTATKYQSLTHTK